ncbi:protein VAPYRIN-like [Rhodamnia argentea]|uniref:Protein VAPYRIN-like n=1 Tax=Rhodamnia argentea TaxID=178133 RepID=A0A8B8N595_9MYRT|nr:protein VAPYRIN-like [Rhodamnia argentea]
MDRLVSLEPSSTIAIRIEPGQRCCGELTLRNVMYTMPVAFKLQPEHKSHYTVKPQSGIIAPLSTLTVEVTYHHPPGSALPEFFPRCDDLFLLHSIVVPGAAVKSHSSAFEVPSDWFTTKKKQVFIDSGLRVMFVGSPIVVQLITEGLMDEIREVMERSDPAWKLVDSVDEHGQTLLHLAIAQGRADLVQLLLEFEPRLEAPDRSLGYSPLAAAAAAGETLIAELLLAHRASIERSETSNCGPVHLATGSGHTEVLKLLLLKGADLNALTKDGKTALHIAVKEQRRDCARLLLSGGAKTDVHDGKDGDTPLHVAASHGDENTVKLLLQKGANKDVRNKYGKTAYDVAAEHGHTKLFDALKLGDKLCSAARKGEARHIHRLLESGAVINGRDQHGWTALHRASFKGHTEAVKALLEKGIDIDTKDEDGYTALHCATESGHMEVVELLVKKGADAEARTNKGLSALQIAESLAYKGISRILGHGGACKDGSAQITGSAASLLGGVGGGSLGRDAADHGGLKKKQIYRRRKGLRGSFDLSRQIAVL